MTEIKRYKSPIRIIASFFLSLKDSCVAGIFAMINNELQ